MKLDIKQIQNGTKATYDIENKTNFVKKLFLFIFILTHWNSFELIMEYKILHNSNKICYPSNKICYQKKLF